MAGEDLLQIRVTADFKQAEEAFLKLSKTATVFESDIRKISANVSREFNKIEGSAELFANSTNVVADKMNVLKNAMQNLMSLGFQPMNPHVQKLKQQYDELGKSLDKVPAAIDKSSKKMSGSNKTMMSLSLILQDLPYGFRGIQNNLPALVGSFAAATGAIYLGFSALIAITTAYEKEIVQLVFGIDDFVIANKRMNEAIADNVGQAKSQIATDQSLIRIINDTTQSTDNRKRALNQLKEEYKGNLELQKIDITDGAELTKVYNKISDALIRKARASAYASLIAEEEAKILKLQTQEGEEVVKNLGYLGATYGILSSAIGGFTISSNIATSAFGKQAKQISQSEKNISLFTKKLNENTEAQIINADIEKLGKGDNEPSQKVNKTNLDKLTAQYNYHKENIFMAEYYGKLMLNEQKRIAIEESKINGTYKQDIANINEEFSFKELTLLQQIENKKFAIRTKSEERQNQLTQSSIKEQEKIAKELTDRSIYFTEQRVKSIESEANSSIKANKGNYQGQKAALEQMLVKLTLLRMAGIGGAEAMIKLNEQFNKTKAQLDGLVDPLDNFNNGLNEIIRDTLQKMAVSLGESLGKMLSGGGGGIEELMNNFIGIMADGLIQIGKLAIGTGLAIKGIKLSLKSLNPYVAIAAGVALVALGTYVKGRLAKSSDSMGGGATAFANGGIVSGPTLGLMGEYPGAKSNPEVIAPLDKLKDMIGAGNGGGSFVLRGTDLVLAMNRSETSLNLRR